MNECIRSFIPYAAGVGFWCPGCNKAHRVMVKEFTPDGTCLWGWNGDWHKTTFTPSILVTCGPNDEGRCHSFVRDGNIQFLSDCNHALAGKTVPVAAHEWPQWVVDEAKKRGQPWPAEA